MMFNTEDKVEAPLLSVPLPTETFAPVAPMREPTMFDPSPPQLQRKATAPKPPKPAQSHNFNPSGRQTPSAVSLNLGRSRASSTSLLDDKQQSKSHLSLGQAAEVEHLLDKVHELATQAACKDDPNEKPVLHDLMHALDTILQQQDGVKHSTEVANQVYRLLIKKEKKKAYDSLVTIQSEIYDLQDQETGILSRSFEKEQERTLQVTKYVTLGGESQNFTFAPKETLEYSESAREGRVNRQPIKVDESHKLKRSRASSQSGTLANATPCYMSDSEFKPQSPQKLKNSSSSILPPKFGKRRDSMPELNTASQNTRSFLYAEPGSVQTGTRADLVSQSQMHEQLTQQSSHKSLSVWNVRSNSVQNLQLASSRSTDQRLLQMPVQMRQTTPQQMAQTATQIVQSHQTPPLTLSSRQTQLQSPAFLEMTQQNATVDTFEIFEEIIHLQKSLGFNRRCEKLIKMQRQQKLENHQHYHSFGTDLLNSDLEQVKSARKLPRFSFKQQEQEQTSTSSSDEKGAIDKNGERSRDKAVDSNKAIVTAYYVKKLLQKSLRCLEKYPKEVKAKKQLHDMAKEKHEKVLQLIALNRMKKYFYRHEGHQRRKLLAEAFFRARIGRTYLRHWLNCMHVEQSDWQKLVLASGTLRKSKIDRIFKTWRTGNLQRKMQAVQLSTAAHIHGQRLMAKSFGALTAFARYQIRAAYLDNKSDIANRQRLEFKAFKSWQRYVMSQTQKLDMGALADSLRRISLQKQALHQMSLYMVIAEHQRNRRQMARAFHNVCLQRTAIKSFLKYKLNKMESFEQNRNVRAFYAANLKVKLMRFLHESNIEFIQHQVKVEDFLLRRKKMRNVMRILYKYAKMQQKQSSFTKVPSPKALYVVHLWLAPHNAKTFSFSNVQTLDAHHGLKYRGKKQNADLLVQNFVASRLFRAWAKQTRKCKALRKRIQKRLLATVIDAWYANSRVNGVLRRKVKSVREQSDTQLKVRLFRALKMNRSSRKRDQRLIKTLQKKTTLFTLKVTFGHWFAQYAAIDNKQRQKFQSASLKRKLYTKKYLAIWRQKFDLIQLKRSLVSRKSDFERDFVKRKFLAKWLNILRNNNVLQSKGQLVHQSKYRDLLARTWYALKTYTELKTRAKFIRQAMDGQYNIKLLARCYKAWKIHAPESQMKTQLCSELDNDYRLRLLQKVIKAFQLNSQFRKERKESDAVMTEAVHGITVRKFFQGWRSLTGKRMGLLVFAETFQKLAQAAFFKRARRKILFEDEATNHMDLMRDYLLLVKTYGAFRLHKQRKDLDAAKTASFQTIRRILNIKEFFGTWKKRYNMIVTKAKITKYAVCHIEGGLMSRCFAAIRDNTNRGMNVRALKAKLQTQMLKRVLCNFLKVTVKQRIAKRMTYNRDQATRQSFFNFWLLEMQERRMIKDLVIRRNTTLALKAIQGLKHNARVQRHRKFLVEQGQANKNFHNAKRVFFALSMHASQQQFHRNALEQMLELRTINRMKVGLRSLYQASINRKIHAMVFSQVSLRTNRRLASDLLQQMRNQSRLRYLQYKSCRILHEKYLKLSVNDALNRWRNVIVLDKQITQITHEFGLYQRTQTLRRTFKALKTVTRAKIIKRNLLMALLEKSVLMRKQTIMQALHNQTRFKHTNRLNKVVALTYRNDRIKRACFEALRTYTLSSRRSKCVVGAVMFQRLVPKAFACLNMHIRVKKVKSEMMLRATQVHQEKLLRKTLTGFVHNAIHKKVSNQNNRQAAQFARCQLRKRAFGQLNAGLGIMKATANKRQILFRAVNGWANDITIKTVFRQFKQAVVQAKADIEHDRAVLQKGKLQRMFTAWQGLKYYNRQLQATSSTVQERRAYYSQKRHLNLLIEAFTDVIQIKIFKRQQETKTLQRSFNCFKLAKNLKKAGQYARLWHQEYIKRAFINAIFTQIDTKQGHEEKVVQMRSVLDTRLKERVLLALRYHLICLNSQKMIRAKLDRMLLVKSFDAFRYYCLSQRIVTRYTSFRDSKIRTSMFTAWRARYVALQQQKSKLQPLISKLFRCNKESAFKLWKKNAFREKFVSTLQQSLLFTSQVETAKTCLQAWRRFAKFARNKAFHSSEITILREYNSKRRVFTDWFNSAMQRAPVTLACTKIQRAHQRIEMRRSFQKVLHLAVYDQELDGLNDAFTAAIAQKRVSKIFSQLKLRAERSRKAKQVILNRARHLQIRSLEQWFTAYDEAQQTKQELEVEILALDQATTFYNEKLVRSCFANLLDAVGEKRRDQQADAYYNEGLLKRSFARISAYKEREQRNGSLTVKANLFRNKNAQSSAKDLYLIWRQRFLKRTQAKQIVMSFQSYSSDRMAGLVMAQWRSWSEKNRVRRTKLDQIAATVSRRQARRIRIETFADMARAARMQQEAKLVEHKACRQAASYFSEKIVSRVFDSWVKLSRKESEQQKRSRMYSVFSAWKFFAKERTLLKRYLFECGESVADVSQMSTIELKLAADKRKNQLRTSQNDDTVLQESSFDYGKPINLVNSQSQLDSSLLDNSSVIREHLNANFQAQKLPSNMGVSRQVHQAKVSTTTPVFTTNSMTEFINLRGRSASPDLHLKSVAAQSVKNEFKSAENTSSRKQSTSVLSILQKQFGGSMTKDQ